MSLFNNGTVANFAESLIRYIPGGKLFQGFRTAGKNQHSFVLGLSPTLQTVNEFLNLYNQEIYPDTTEEFLEEWESAVGLPDSCLAVDGETIEDRQRNIVLKLAEMNVQTSQDFVDIAALFGVAATVVGGKDPSVSPVITPDKTARFTIVVQFIPTTVFPYTFPIVFGSSAIGVLECLFLKIRPANCAVRFDSL